MPNPFVAVAGLFRPKPSEPLPHVQIRYVAATRRENDEARLRRETLTNNLRCAVNDLSPEARMAARARALRAGRGRA